MNVSGRFVNKESLEGWKREPLAGEVPALHIEFEFVVLRGDPERLPMWGMIDSGADSVVVPGRPVGLWLEADGQTPHIVEGSTASKLRLIRKRIKGIGGTTFGFSAPCFIKLGGVSLVGVRDVIICDGVEYPLIGRDVLKHFAGLFHPWQKRLTLSDCWYLCAPTRFATACLGVK